MKKLVLMVLEENRILREMLAKEWGAGRMSCSHDFEQRRKVIKSVIKVGVYIVIANFFIALHKKYAEWEISSSNRKKRRK